MEGKDKILKIAIKIFAEKGLTKTKIQDIANAAGISKKTIYKFFDSKQDLIHQVYGGLITNINSQVEELVSSDSSVAKKLAGIIEISLRNLDVVTPVLVKEAKESLPDIKDFIHQYIEHAVFNRFRKLIQEGIESEEIKYDVEVDSVILLYRDAILAFLYMRFNRDVPGNVTVGSPVSIFSEALFTIFRGILTPSSEKEFNAHLSFLNY